MNYSISSQLHRIGFISLLTISAILPSFAQGKYEPSGDRVYHGAALSNFGSEDGLRQQAQRYRQLSGKNLAIITWFASQFENGRTTSWRRDYSDRLGWVKRSGSVSLIKFSTCDFAYKNTRKMAAPRDIARGAYDSYFNEFADTVKDFGDPVFISINHEMNGNWYPYSQDFSGTSSTSGDYVSMWRRIVSIFRSRGANNVAWVWSPNVPSVGRASANNYYPGDSYVDWIGPSFYSGNQLDAMDDLYRTYANRKPFFITEWATSREQSRYNKTYPGDAQWVSGFFATMQKRYPRVKAISWFDWNKSDGDHRLERVSAQQRAYTAQVRNPRYLDNARDLIGRNYSNPAPVRIAARSTAPYRSTPSRSSTPATPSFNRRLRLTISAQRNPAIQR